MTTTSRLLTDSMRYISALTGNAQHEFKHCRLVYGNPNGMEAMTGTVKLPHTQNAARTLRLVKEKAGTSKLNSTVTTAVTDSDEEWSEEKVNITDYNMSEVTGLRAKEMLAMPIQYPFTITVDVGVVVKHPERTIVFTSLLPTKTEDCIPLLTVPDSESDSHEVQPRETSPSQLEANPQSQPRSETQEENDVVEGNDLE
jgi:hypothetical protein